MIKSPFTFIHTVPETTADKQPAIFLLHGMGSNEKDLPQLVQDFKESHHIFSLRAPIVFDPGYAFFTIEEEGKPIRAEFDEILNYIQSFIQEAIVEYGLDEDHITVLGFSQGAVLAEALALTMGAVIRNVVALSGYVPDFVKMDYENQPVDHLNIFISHGVYDYIVPPHWGEESKEYFESLGAHVIFKTYNDGHGVTPENHRDLVAFLRSH